MLSGYDTRFLWAGEIAEARMAKRREIFGILLGEGCPGSREEELLECDLLYNYHNAVWLERRGINTNLI